MYFENTKMALYQNSFVRIWISTTSHIILNDTVHESYNRQFFVILKMVVLCYNVFYLFLYGSFFSFFLVFWNIVNAWCHGKAIWSIQKKLNELNTFFVFFLSRQKSFFWIYLNFIYFKNHPYENRFSVDRETEHQ